MNLTKKETRVVMGSHKPYYFTGNRKGPFVDSQKDIDGKAVNFSIMEMNKAHFSDLNQAIEVQLVKLDKILKNSLDFAKNNSSDKNTYKVIHAVTGQIKRLQTMQKLIKQELDGSR